MTKHCEIPAHLSEAQQNAWCLLSAAERALLGLKSAYSITLDDAIESVQNAIAKLETNETGNTNDVQNP